MSSLLGLGLLYVGAVLLINGLLMGGKISNSKDSAIMNFFTGGLVFIVALHTALNLDAPFAAAQSLLFAFTYLWVGVNAYTQQEDQKGLGWYCLFVAIVTIPTAYITLMSGDMIMAAVWLSWGILWFMYYLVLGLLKINLTQITVNFTFFNAILTGTIGYMMLAGWLI